MIVDPLLVGLVGSGLWIASIFGAAHISRPSGWLAWVSLFGLPVGRIAWCVMFGY